MALRQVQGEGAIPATRQGLEDPGLIGRTLDIVSSCAYNPAHLECYAEVQERRFGMKKLVIVIVFALALLMAVASPGFAYHAPSPGRLGGTGIGIQSGGDHPLGAIDKDKAFCPFE